MHGAVISHIFQFKAQAMQNFTSRHIYITVKKSNPILVQLSHMHLWQPL